MKCAYPLARLLKRRSTECQLFVGNACCTYPLDLCMAFLIVCVCAVHTTHTVFLKWVFWCFATVLEINAVVFLYFATGFGAVFICGQYLLLLCGGQQCFHMSNSILGLNFDQAWRSAEWCLQSHHSRDSQPSLRHCGGWWKVWQSFH